MSETEHHVGKLIPVKLAGSIEETCKKILQDMGIEIDNKFYDSVIEQLNDEGYKKYFTTKDAIYKVELKEIDPYDDIARATKNADGSVDFEVRYYNGGADLSEMLKYALEGMKS